MSHRIDLTEYEADKLDGFSVIPSSVLGLPKVKIHTLAEGNDRQQKLADYISGLSTLNNLLGGGAFLNGLLWNFAASRRISEKEEKILTFHNMAITQCNEIEKLRFENGRLAYKLAD